MTQSETIAELSKALTVFSIKVESITKDAANPYFKSKYASLSNILEAIKDPLNESGLSIAQFPTGANGLTTILMHESGEWIKSEYEMKPVKDDPQGRGSCLTYQRRYSLASILNLNFMEDDDANQATHPQGFKEKPWLNEGETLNKVIAKLQAGQVTIDQIKEHYQLSYKINQQLLMNTPKVMEAVKSKTVKK